MTILDSEGEVLGRQGNGQGCMDLGLAVGMDAGNVGGELLKCLVVSRFAVRSKLLCYGKGNITRMNSESTIWLHLLRG